MILANMVKTRAAEAATPVFGQIVTAAAMSRREELRGDIHVRLVHYWLQETLEFRVRDMVEYLRGFGDRCVEITRELLKQETDDRLLPADLDQMHREHFAREMDVVVPLAVARVHGAETQEPSP